MSIKNLNFDAAPINKPTAPLGAALRILELERKEAESLSEEKKKSAFSYSENERALAVKAMAGVRAKSLSPTNNGNELLPAKREAKEAPMTINEAGEAVVDYGKLDTPACFRKNQTRESLATKVTQVVTPPDSLKSAAGIQPMMSSKLSPFIQSLVTTHNPELGCIDYAMPNDDHVAFHRFPDAISIGDAQMDEEIILAMLELGKNDFGSIEVYGSKEFMDSAIAVAIKHGIVLQNPEYLQAISNTHAPRPKMRA